MRVRPSTAVALSVLITFAVALIACEAAPTAVPTKTPRPTFTATAAIPTVTPTPEITATPTPMPPTSTPTPDPNLNPLTGLVVSDTSTLQRRPFEVVVNNMPVARPQYGLGRADVVFEYVMDGWSVTRFTAVYYSQEAERIGPVRSARLVNLYLGPMFDGALVASGASVDVRWLLRNKGAFPYLDIDLDDASNTAYSTSIGTYWETRLQTSTAALRRWLQKTGQEKSVVLKSFEFSAQFKAQGSSAGKTVTIPYPEGSSVSWAFDAGSGRYSRSVAGEPHKDASTDSQLTGVNVVVIFASHGKTNIVEDSLGNTAIQIGLAGEGKSIVLRDGLAWKGTWKWSPPLEAATIATGDTVVVAKGAGSPLQLLDAGGQVIFLKPGNTWFEIVPADYRVDVK